MAGVAASVSSLFAQTSLYTHDFNETDGFNGWVVENLGTSPEEWTIRAINPGFLTTGDNGTMFAYGFNAQAGAYHDGNTRVTSTAINTTGHDIVFMQFEHIFAFQVSNDAVGTIEVSNDSTNWEVVATIDEQNTDPELYKVDLGATAANQATVYVRLTYDSYGDYYWIVDDLEVFAPAPGSDIVVEGLSIASYEDINASPFTNTLSVFNDGTVEITEVEVEISVNGGAATTENITGLNIGKLASGTIELPALATPNAGFYNVQATITTVNGAADNNTANNSASNGLIAYDGANAMDRVPFYEIFTSSTCAPCRPGNQNYHSIVDNFDKDSYVSIKYQQNFPGTGDPYATAESIARRGYYSINSIPRMEANGGWDQNATSFTNSLHNQFSELPAVATMDGEYTVDYDGQSVSYNFDITPSFDLPEGSATLYIAIVENTTYDNRKTNGETEFESVMKKMIPGIDGQPIMALTAGQATNVSGTYVFQGDYRLPNDGQPASHINHDTEHSVEEFEDLHVIAWIQHDASKTVLQAGNLFNTRTSVTDLSKAQVEEVSVYPNPAKDQFTVSFDLLNNADVTLNVVNMAGQVVDTKAVTAPAGNVMVEFGANQLPNGNYTVQVVAEGEVIATSKVVVAH